MDLPILIGAAGGFVAFGLGTGLGIRLIPTAFSAARSNYKIGNNTNREPVPFGLNAADQRSGTRQTDIVGIFNDVFRHRDGSYSAAYHLQIEPTMLSDDQIVEGRCDEIARMLALAKPAGTLIQFRYSSGPDPGLAINDLIKAQGQDGINLHAAHLQALTVAYYMSLADNGNFRRDVLTMVVRVPPTRETDGSSSGLDAFFVDVSRHLKSNGVSNIAGAFRQSWRDNVGSKVVRRLLEEESECYGTAAKVFRAIENDCPLSIRRFTGDELWSAAYRGHSLGAKSVPVCPETPGYEFSDYLKGESLSFQGDIVIHGKTPVGMVSLFKPPQPDIQANLLRFLIGNPNLTFPHTLISEFIYSDQQKAVKRLDSRLAHIKRAKNGLAGINSENPESVAATQDLRALRHELARGNEALVEARVYGVVYGSQVNTEKELRSASKEIEKNCELLIAAMRKMNGADASREDAAALKALYEASLFGESGQTKTGREITEVTTSLAALAPVEGAWRGSARPHTLLSTVSGRLIGLDLYDSTVISSPLALVLGQPGSGKSTLLGRLANDILASLPDARVRALDFGESFRPHVNAINGSHMRFNPDDKRTINIWDYPGLETGELPSEVQIALVVADAMKLARASDSLAEDILTNLVAQVYQNEVPRNGLGGDRHEPRHSHLLALLDSYPSESASVRERASALAVALEKYRDHPWLDAPTHPDFQLDASYVVFELDSLDVFPPDIRETLACRVAARVIRSIGQLTDDGLRTPTLLIFDEVWKVVQKYPDILNVIKKGARMGRKERVCTILATHAYEDLTSLFDITKTASVKIVGKQVGDNTLLSTESGLSDNGQAAIRAIKNVPGQHAQYVLSIGSGQDQIVEMVQVELSPTELWTYTTNPIERNARAKVGLEFPQLTVADVIAWLASKYPRGLAYAGLTDVEFS